MWLIFLSFLQVLTPAGNDLENHSKAQAEFYIQNIKEGTQLEENIWALALLGSEHDEIAGLVEKEVSGITQSTDPLFLFKKFEPTFRQQLKKIVFATGSPNLLAALLLKYASTKERRELLKRFRSEFNLQDSKYIDRRVNYNSLLESIVERTAISDEEIPSKSFHLIHFFTLYSSDRDKLFTEDYLKSVTQNWNTPSSLPLDYLDSTFERISQFKAYYLLNKYSETASLYNSLINIKVFPNTPFKLNIFRFLDYSMYRLGYYDRNLEIARNHTLPLAKYLNRKQFELVTKYSIGINLYSIGKIHEAERVYKEVLAVKDEEFFNLSLSSLYNNLGITYLKLGKYDDFLNLQFQALETAKETGNYSHQMEIYNNLFVYYRSSNNPSNALQYLEEAQRLAEEKGNNADIGKIYINLGSAYINFDQDFKRASEYFQKAESILDSENDSRYFIDVLNEQGQAYEEQDSLKKALKKYIQLASVTLKNNSPNHIDAIVNQALIHLKMNHVEKAGKIIEQYKEFDLSQLDFNQIVKAETVEADYLYQTGHTDAALKILRPTLEHVVERAKSSGDLETGHWHVEDEYLDAFELATSILIDEGAPEEAVEILDQLKTVNDASLYQNPLVKSSLLNETELTQYKQLTAQLDESRKRLLAAEEGERFTIQQTINQLNSKKGKFDRRLTKQVEKAPVSVRQVQNKLSAYELVLHITELNDHYYISHITRSNISVDIIPFDSTKRELFRGALQQVATHEANLDSLYALTQFLELQEIPDHINKVTVIPDSYLYQLPIDVLPMDKPAYPYSYGDVTYFIEQFETRYLTSLSDFSSGSNTDASSRFTSDFVGYGVSEFNGRGQKNFVPLPFAETEIKMISQNLTNLPDKQTYINKSSTKAAFNRSAAQGRILHLATHSEISDRDPLFSAIQMDNSQSPGNTHENQIYAYELFQLNLNNELVMMNSCESGSGSYLQGTGVMGISRALQYAGANALILNLWSVNDMLASDFAIHFYQLLNEGKSKAEALRDTKRYFLENKNASPHFWGPYMLIGDDEPVVAPNRNINLIVAGTFSFYFLLLVSLSYLKSQGLIFSNRKKKAA